MINLPLPYPSPHRLPRLSLHLLAAILFLAAAAGCTRNNGDIGPLFGTWRLDEITIDGAPDQGYSHNMFWLFQSHVVSMQTTDDATADSYQSWGSWQRSSGDLLILDFRHSDQWNEPGSEMYSPMAETHLPVNQEIPLNIIVLSDKRMQLRYVAPDATVYEYFLTKYK